MGRLPQGFRFRLTEGPPKVDAPQGVTLLGEVQVTSVVHACPDGGAVTPCCGRTPFEIPRWHRITGDPERVTCGKEPADA